MSGNVQVVVSLDNWKKNPEVDALANVEKLIGDAYSVIDKVFIFACSRRIVLAYPAMWLERA